MSVPTRIIAFVNLKGGSGKTTSTAFVSHALKLRGKSVLVIDADPQASALRWTEQADWAVPLVALPVRNLHARIAGFVPAEVDIIVIDTPPMGDHAGIVHSVLRIADLVVVTVAPTMLEFERLGSVWQAIEEANEVREHPIASAVLLNRTVANARSTGIFRDLIEADGHAVLRASVPRREAIAQAFGAAVHDSEHYGRVADELLQRLELR